MAKYESQIRVDDRIYTVQVLVVAVVRYPPNATAEDPRAQGPEFSKTTCVKTNSPLWGIHEYKQLKLVLNCWFFIVYVSEEIKLREFAR